MNICALIAGIFFIFVVDDGFKRIAEAIRYLKK